MPLITVIDDLVLGEASDAEGQYLYLLDPRSYRFVAGGRFRTGRGYIETVNLVAQGYGPTLWLLLMQKARREALTGVAPDLEWNSEEAKRMDARFYYEPLPGVSFVPNPDAHQPEVYLNQIYSLAADLIDERRARRNGKHHFGCTPWGRVRLREFSRRDPARVDAWHTRAGVLARLREYVNKSEIPFKDIP